MEAIRETISSVLKSIKEKKSIYSQDDYWVLLKKILTKKELEHIKVNYFRKGVLNINVDSSTWLYKLSLEKEALIAKLNKESSVVKDVRFRIGEIL
ncbi:MAG: DciA family protein [Candidatus Omnitrophica bacterium]|nr:DciA family protein [Candidatus Omnitrophota bacterium]